MAHVAIDIAEAVKDEINDHTFSVAITAARAFVPKFDLKDMSTLHVTVVPKALDVTTATRTSATNDVAVDVAVQKIVDPDDIVAGDVLMSIVQEIADFFVRRKLTDPVASWIRTEQVLYSPEDMNEKRLFTNVLTFTFRTVR